jgi:nitrilase
MYADDDDWMSEGNSVIIGPDGRILAGPLVGSEGIVMAELDIERARSTRMQFDPVGHYSRPDVFKLSVDTSPRSNVEKI